jgi:hypothetical protein
MQLLLYLRVLLSKAATASGVFAEDIQHVARRVKCRSFTQVYSALLSLEYTYNSVYSVYSD